mgnify:CR=1 FL=1
MLNTAQDLRPLGVLNTMLHCGPPPGPRRSERGGGSTCGEEAQRTVTGCVADVAGFARVSLAAPPALQLLLGGRVDMAMGNGLGALNFVREYIPFCAIAAVFQKKTQATPPGEIDNARRRLAAYDAI